MLPCPAALPAHQHRLAALVQGQRAQHDDVGHGALAAAGGGCGEGARQKGPESSGDTATQLRRGAVPLDRQGRVQGTAPHSMALQGTTSAIATHQATGPPVHPPTLVHQVARCFPGRRQHPRPVQTRGLPVVQLEQAAGALGVFPKGIDQQRVQVVCHLCRPAAGRGGAVFGGGGAGGACCCCCCRSRAGAAAAAAAGSRQGSLRGCCGGWGAAGRRKLRSTHSRSRCSRCNCICRPRCRCRWG